MFSLQISLLQSKHPFPPPPSSHCPTKHKTQTSQWIEHGQYGAKKRRNLFYFSYSSRCWSVHAVEKDSQQQFEVDPEKAKEALQQLDQQLQTLSKKQVSTPKIRASDVKIESEKRVVVEEGSSTEISGSFLAYLTIALLIFTIFYNVLFYAVIKPSVDGPDFVPQPTALLQ